MTQTVPATAVLGPGKTGLTIGLRVLNLDGTEYAAFATTDVAETSVAGTYRKAGGVVCPDAGAYLVWGVSGTDYAEATVDAAAPTAAENADAVWDEATSGHVAAGSTGKALTDILEDTGTTLPAAISAVAAEGAGAIAHTITIENENGPVDGAEVWITTDQSGDNVVAGTLSTDVFGNVTFMLDAGSYYAWVQLAPDNFPNPTPFTVS